MYLSIKRINVFQWNQKREKNKQKSENFENNRILSNETTFCNENQYWNIYRKKNFILVNWQYLARDNWDLFLRDFVKKRVRSLHVLICLKFISNCEKSIFEKIDWQNICWIFFCSRNQLYHTTRFEFLILNRSTQ